MMIPDLDQARKLCDGMKRQNELSEHQRIALTQMIRIIEIVHDLGAKDESSEAMRNMLLEVLARDKRNQRVH